MTKALQGRPWGMLVGLAATNLVLLALLVGREAPFGKGPIPAPAEASSSWPSPEVAPVLRGRALELVDDRGRIRSRLDVQPDGEIVLRLIAPDGAIRVKLGAGQGGSGLLLLDEATEPGVQLLARRRGSPARPGTTSLTLRGTAGRERVVRP